MSRGLLAFLCTMYTLNEVLFSIVSGSILLLVVYGACLVTDASFPQTGSIRTAYQLTKTHAPTQVSRYAWTCV